MRYLALACDYDGTIATDGHVPLSTLRALEQVLATGRKLILVTGRELDDLAENFSALDLFEWIVAENGGVLYSAARREERLLAAPPPPAFADALRERGVRPMSVGKVVVATWRPHETTVLEVIRDLRLELQIIFNKEAVMVLPSGVNKASGLTAALGALALSPHNVVGVGDAENDHAFLALTGVSVAVSNAIDTLKDEADLTTSRPRGAGVEELVRLLVDDDLRDVTAQRRRHDLVLGELENGTPCTVHPTGENILIAGPSGSGKSTVATALLERLIDASYQVCIVDPEGDYQTLEKVVTSGSTDQPPVMDEALRVLESTTETIALNLVGTPVNDRPALALSLFPELQKIRALRARPHWILWDEAHHLFPASWAPVGVAVPRELDGIAMVTVHPGQIAPVLLQTLTMAIAVGPDPASVFTELCGALGEAPPKIAPSVDSSRVVYLWRRGEAEAQPVRITPARAVRRRHTKKYAEGTLPPERSFYFRGPEERLNLRAQNLLMFIHIADGVDDDTWMHHLKQHDYSAWLREKIRDESLADEVEVIESESDLSPLQSRDAIRRSIEARYTAPATPVFPMPGTDAKGRRSTNGD